MKDSHGNIKALKGALEDHVSALAEEFAKYRSEALHAIGATISCEKHFVDDRRRFAGLLLDPVGRPLKRSRDDVRAALISLKKLNAGGFLHDGQMLLS